MLSKPYLIAEAGVNHNGDLPTAIRLVEAAAEAGADAIKFQTFRADKLVTEKAPKANYQKKTTNAQDSQHEMLKRLQLSDQDHIEIVAACKANCIEFMTSVFDADSLDFVSTCLKPQRLKFGSGELTNAPLLFLAAQSGSRIILSTGMGTLAEIELALGALALGMMGAPSPTKTLCVEALNDPSAHVLLQERVTLLHCTTEYPSSYADSNLRAIETIRRATGLPVGYSDHTDGIAVSLAAVALGAIAIEKHLTLDRSMAGPDHSSSVEPLVLAELAAGINAVHLALGDRIKRPTEAERANRSIVRKGLYAARDIAKGRKIEEADIAIKRPTALLDPITAWELVGSVATRSFSTGDPLER